MSTSPMPPAEFAGHGTENSDALAGARLRSSMAPLSNIPFLSNMSHEINTPMHGVISMLDLLLESGLTTSQREMASIALASAENLQALFCNILDFSKIQTQTLGLHQRSFDLIRKVQEVTATYAAMAERKQLTFIVNYPTSAQRHVIGDPDRIGQVITNLLNNAIKFTNQGQVVLDLNIVENSIDHCQIKISVTDTGGGLPAAFLDDVFSKITPGDISTTKQHSGAGLSLAISKQLLDLMGGEIGVESHPGKGCRFWFSLDLARTPNALANLRVLFVNKQEEGRLKTERELNEQGMRANGFETANAAMQALEQAVIAKDPYHIAILDQQMPGIDGETLGMALKLDPAYSDLKLILLSTISRASDAQRFSQAGFSAIIRKPVAPQLMLDTLSALASAIKSGAQGLLITHATAPSLNEIENPFEKSRILVVDDSTVNQMVAERMLEKLGCRAKGASSGKTAIEMLDAGEYDLVLMDCQMPELDGYQTTATIRAKEAGQRHTPIIGWTAYALQDGEDKCLAAGMDDFMTKPIRPEALQKILSRWLRPITKPETMQKRATDSDELDAVRDMFGKDFGELAKLFRTDSPERIAALYRAAAEGNAEMFSKVAHALSGSSASIGATGMAALCKELEINAKSGMPANVMARLAEIDVAYSKIESRLLSMVA